MSDMVTTLGQQGHEQAPHVDTKTTEAGTTDDLDSRLLRRDNFEEKTIHVVRSLSTLNGPPR